MFFTFLKLFKWYQIAQRITDIDDPSFNKHNQIAQRITDIDDSNFNKHNALSTSLSPFIFFQHQFQLTISQTFPTVWFILV